jgi:hypothetical protein
LAIRKTTGEELPSESYVGGDVELQNGNAQHHAIDSSGTTSITTTEATRPEQDGGSISTTSPTPGTIIDIRLPYRHGYPTLPVLPVITLHPMNPPVFPSFSKHMHNLRILLFNHEVHVHDIQLVYRYHVKDELSTTH